MGESLGDSLSFKTHLNTLNQVLYLKRYENDDERPFKVGLLIDVYQTEKAWFDDDNAPKIPKP